MTENKSPERPPGGTTRDLPVAPRQGPVAPASNPLIPLHIVDAPSQRLYAAACYVLLLAWKIYDWVGLVEGDTESFWLFMKWTAIDAVYLFGLPELRIPWLELTRPVVWALFALELFVDWMLMFNIGFPWQTWLISFFKIFYDHELAIQEHNVKLSNILHNDSLIMGRQIINILPEGTAVLNPDRTPFCVSEVQKTAEIPIYFNATVPVQVEIIRVDLETNKEETFKLTRSQIRAIETLAKSKSKDDGALVFQYNYLVKKPGAYRLGTVLDEYNLEVQRKTHPAFVVSCPRVILTPSSQNRCLGDLSDLSLKVDGTPPLKLHYSRMINGKDRSFHFQSLQPEGFVSPLVGTLPSHNSLISTEAEDVTWARSQRITVGLNESLHQGGHWRYLVDEVQDTFGNVIKYGSADDDPDAKPKPNYSAQDFTVKERPRMRLKDCEIRKPLLVPKSQQTRLPTLFEVSGPTPDDTAHEVGFVFSPLASLTNNGDHGDDVSTFAYKAKNAFDQPSIKDSGLYTLKTISAGGCEGEIQEPSSCLLINPLEPRLTLRSEPIPDQCAGNTVGLRVDLDLVGNPPFEVRYEVNSGYSVQRKKMVIAGTRHQIDLIPDSEGTHRYSFTHISDHVYKSVELKGSEYVLTQSVKPSASAKIRREDAKTDACLDEESTVKVEFTGDPPYALEWELVHDGKRQPFKATEIHSRYYTIVTPPLTQGGDYIVALTSVQDVRGCRNFAQDELKVSIRRQRPRASFGLIENKRRATVVEAAKVRLPVRLTGQGPWTLSYRNTDESDDVKQVELLETNDFISVMGRGGYEIMGIRDNLCQGNVDAKASTFAIDWHPRPQISLLQADSIVEQGDIFSKTEVCEGDIDSFNVAITGSPPFHVAYQVEHTPSQGSKSVSQKVIDSMNGQASIQVDTGKSGLYVYKFSAPADNLYDGDRAGNSVVVLEQRVNTKPSASFGKPSHTYKYCTSDQEYDDKIPITLTGVPPFDLEVETKHQGGGPVLDRYNIRSIESHSYGLQLPKDRLKQGLQHVRIRGVKDAKGCRTQTDFGGPSVQVQLFDAPAIYPLEARTDYCVGERLSYSLSGTPPFEVWYTFEGQERKAKSPTTNFRRVAEKPGNFVINSVSDRASECRAAVGLQKTIHPLPAVKISKGRNVKVDIHEGTQVEIVFDFWGTPPFEFTYTRSTNERRGHKSQILETRHDVSYEHSKSVMASQEGTYEVVAIKDAFCSFQTQKANKAEKGQKLLQY